jgi:hypothetical protein
VNVKPAGRVSTTLKPLEAEGPSFVTVIRYLPPLPAVTGSKSLPVHSSTFVSERSVTRWTVVSTVFEVLFVELLSVVPFEATLAWFDRVLPAAAFAVRVTWIVNTFDAPTARPLAVVQVTSCPAAEHSAEEPLAWNVRPDARVSVTVKPPVWADGPLFVTVTV